MHSLLHPDRTPKTLSAAPAWSREVSRLMNPESDTDWRLLAQRLNFTAEDIRAWATTPDPCMSLFAEFYTNNRAAEASKAVLQQLKEMNRLDAAAIVEAAILNAGECQVCCCCIVHS